MLFRHTFAILLLSMSAAAALAKDQTRVQPDDWAAMLGHYLTILDENPADHEAIKGAWLCSMRLGLYNQADGFRSVLNKAEIDAMEGDQIALAIRYGRIDMRTLTGSHRYQTLDAALKMTDTLAQDFFDGQLINAEQQRRLIDRLTALTERGRPLLAIDLFEKLQSSQIPIPAWALRDVAGAYLSQREPRTAEQLYRRSLTQTPDDFDANIGLYYALLESEQVDLAERHIDQFAARLPLRRRLDNQANTERTSADLLTDRQRVYANRLLLARKRILERLVGIPFNQEARGVESSVDLALGWQRRAEMETRTLIVNDPENPGLRADHAEQLLALQRWEQAQAELETAWQLHPEQPRVLLAADMMALWQRPELNILAGYGRGENKDPFGSTDYHVDTWLYSSPIYHAIRLYLHNTTASADFFGTSTSWVRSGPGVEWRVDDWKASVEINGGEFAKTGALTTVQWQIDDAWKVLAHADSVTNDIPMQAVSAKITAWQSSLGVDYQIIDGRKFAIETGTSGFSDGNQRKSVIATWQERWASGPRWTIDTTIGADEARNSLGYETAYFNPPASHSIWLTGAADQLAWRNYDWSLHHRLSFSIGNFWQSDYDRGTTAALDYQHRWELGRSASLTYSIGRSVRPYDGVREARNYGAMTLLWRF